MRPARADCGPDGWPWLGASIPGGYQPGAICRETAGCARSVAATPSVFLVADRIGDLVQVTNRTAVAIAPGWCSELIQPALESVVVAHDRPETLGLRRVASLDFGVWTPRVFSLGRGTGRCPGTCRRCLRAGRGWNRRRRITKNPIFLGRSGCLTAHGPLHSRAETEGRWLPSPTDSHPPTKGFTTWQPPPKPRQ